MVKVFFHRCLLGACSARLLKVRSLVGCADPLNRGIAGDVDARLRGYWRVRIPTSPQAAG